MTFSAAGLQPFGRSSLVTLVAICCLTMFGCARDLDQTAPEKAVLGMDIGRQEPASLQDGGNLRLPISAFPANFNPLNSDASNFEGAARATYPRAFMVGRDGLTTLNIDYFTNATVTGTKPQVVTYTINPKAVWSDGTPITWEDIASEIHALSGVDPAFNIDSPPGFERVASITRGADDRQAVITFRTPYSEWREMFAGVNMLLPRSMTATPAAFNKGYLVVPGPSAGPFIVSDADKSAGRIVLERNPRWWGRVPRLRFITYVVLDPADQLSSLLDQGQVDATRLTSAEDIARTEAKLTQGVVIRRAPEIRSTSIYYNGYSSILADKDLRSAITRGIDREAIVNVLQRDMTANPVPLGNHIFMPTQPCYSNNVPPQLFDPFVARKMLDDLGWKLNGDVREKGGKQLMIRDVFFDDDTDWEIAHLLQSELGQIGVRLVIDNHPDGNFFAEGGFDLTHFESSSDAFPLSTMEQGYKSNEPQNGGKISDPETDRMIEQAVTESNPLKACDLANKIDSVVWYEEHSLPLAQSPGVMAVRSSVANYGAFGMADIDYTAIGFTK